jgi:hypothetical protein
MPEYLSPAEVEHWVAMLLAQRDVGIDRKADTLREMAAVVTGVAKMETDICPWCNAWLMPHSLLVSKIDTDGLTEYVRSEIEDQEAQPHSSDCLYLRARRVMGYE